MRGGTAGTYRNTNLGTGNSRSQSHLDSGNYSRDRPSLQRQGTFTETRKSRPHSVEYSDSSATTPPLARAGSGTNRPLSGPPSVRQTSRTDPVMSGTRLARQMSDNSAHTRQTSDSTRHRAMVSGTTRVSTSRTSTRPHSHCYTRTSPSPTFTRKYRGSPNRGRMI